jgi:hypothetical protein
MEHGIMIVLGHRMPDRFRRKKTLAAQAATDNNKKSGS